MDRVVLIVGAVAIAALVAWILDRRRPARPTAPTASVPTQLDRHDFTEPGTAWLVAVFTADTCTTCASLWDQARGLVGPGIAAQELEVTRDAALHRRYDIDAVPTLLIADSDGVVVRWFLGPIKSGTLEEAVTEVSSQERRDGER